MRILIFAFILLSVNSFAQKWTVTEMAPMPMRISNNAVCEGTVSNVPYVYSFGGIDSTKIYSGIRKNSFRYNTVTDMWEQIADLPDTSGKIASAASNVKNKIYIIGGYHVSVTGTETSSNKVHVYDPQSNTFLPDAANIPVAIDDQVQCVWRDSLIYVITGWSNTTNVPNVQIFNPSTNSWSAGTPVPNNTTYKVFGGSGIITGDTIFYYGGAATGFNFPAQNKLRMGIIDPLNPTSITWSQPSQNAYCYRCAATSDSLGNIHILGGSSVSYNYDGIAYNGSGGVEPNTSYSYFHPSDPIIWYDRVESLPMDLRGIANISPNLKYIAGGMESNQTVSNNTLKLEFQSTVGIDETEFTHKYFQVYPNPSSGRFTAVFENECNELILTDLTGNEILKMNTFEKRNVFYISENGVYFLYARSGEGVIVQKIIVNE